MSAPGLLKMVHQVRLMNWVGIGPGGIGDEWDQGLGLGLDNSKGLGEI